MRHTVTPAQIEAHTAQVQSLIADFRSHSRALVDVGKRAKVTVRVKAAGLARPTGTVTVKYGKKSVKAKLKASAQGKVTVRLPKLKKGRYKITASFKPSKASGKYVRSAKASRVTLRVR